MRIHTHTSGWRSHVNFAIHSQNGVEISHVDIFMHISPSPLSLLLYVIHFRAATIAATCKVALSQHTIIKCWRSALFVQQAMFTCKRAILDLDFTQFNFFSLFLSTITRACLRGSEKCYCAETTTWPIIQLFKSIVIEDVIILFLSFEQ